MVKPHGRFFGLNHRYFQKNKKKTIKFWTKARYMIKVVIDIEIGSLNV